MESKMHSPSYEDLKEKMKKYEEGNIVNVWKTDSRTMEGARVKNITQ